MKHQTQNQLDRRYTENPDPSMTLSLWKKGYDTKKIAGMLRMTSESKVYNLLGHLRRHGAKP